MSRLISYNRRDIASKRLRFLFYEIVPIFVIVFALLIVEWVVLPLFVNQSSALFGIFFYFFRALSIFSVIILFLFVFNKIKLKNSKLDKELTPHIGFLKLYNMTNKNYSYQILYSFLLFFLILIPLEFLIAISLPETISHSAIALLFETQNSYLLLDNFALFLISSIVINLSVSFSNETIYRGLIAKRGSEHFNKVSAVLTSTLFFTLSEVLLNPLLSSQFGFILFIKSFIVGLLFSLTIIRRKWLFPLIIANTINSILSSVLFWNILRGGNYAQLLIVMYVPLMVISLILLILQRSRVKESLQIGIKMIRSYFRSDNKVEQSTGDKIFRILFDIFLALLLFLFGFLISV